MDSEFKKRFLHNLDKYFPGAVLGMFDVSARPCVPSDLCRPLAEICPHGG